MVQLDEIVPIIQAEAQNVPEDSIRTAIVHAVRDLCRRGRVWQEDSDVILVAGLDYAQISIPANSQCIDCLYIKTNGTNNIHSKKEFSLTSGAGDIELAWTPATTVFATARVVLVPTSKANSITDDLWLNHEATIHSGALYYLKSQHGREWYEPNVALYHQQEFERGIGDASREAVQKYLRSPVKMKEKFI